MIHLTLPDGKEICDGAVLSFGDDLTKYILHFGKYKVGNSYMCGSGSYQTGWYVQAFGSGIAIPLTDDMLSMCKIYNTGAELTVQLETVGCNHHHHLTFKDQPETFTTQDKYLLDRSWITVDTITERNSLPRSIVMTGRIIEVNNVDDEGPRYFRWNYKKQDWDTIIFVHSDIAADLEKMNEQIKMLHLVMFGSCESSSENSTEAEVNTPVSPVDPLPVISMITMLQDMHQNSIDTKERVDKLIEDLDSLKLRVVELEPKHQNSTESIQADLALRYSNIADTIVSNSQTVVIFDDTALQACGIHNKIKALKSQASDISVSGMCESDTCNVISAEVMNPRKLKFVIVPNICEGSINHKANMIIHCELIPETES